MKDQPKVLVMYGTTNRGGGGGGGSRNAPAYSAPGFNGGSGIVIINTG